MESPYPTPAGAGRRLEQGAAISRIKGQFRDAHRDYLLALGVHRRAGSLAGVLEISTRLGELYEATNTQSTLSATTSRLATSEGGCPRQITPHARRGQRGAASGTRAVGIGGHLQPPRDLSTGVDVEIVAELLPPLLAHAALEPGGRNSLALTVGRRPRWRPWHYKLLPNLARLP